MKNRFNITEEEKNRIKGLHSINEQSGFVDSQGGSARLDKFNGRQEGYEMTEQPEVADGGIYLDPNQDVETQLDSLQTVNHKSFMDGVHSMCDKIEGMGDKMVGRRKCDGNTTDGSGGCYEPLIKLVKKYCKTR